MAQISDLMDEMQARREIFGRNFPKELSGYDAGYHAFYRLLIETRLTELCESNDEEWIKAHAIASVCPTCGYGTYGKFLSCPICEEVGAMKLIMEV